MPGRVGRRAGRAGASTVWVRANPGIECCQVRRVPPRPWMRSTTGLFRPWYKRSRRRSAAGRPSCRRLHAYSPPCRRVPGGSPLGTRVHPELPRRNYRNARLRAVALTLSPQGRRVPGRLDCQPGFTLRDRCRLAVVRGCSLGVQARADGYMARSTRVIKRWLCVGPQRCVQRVGFSTVSRRSQSNRPGKPQGPPGREPSELSSEFDHDRAYDAARALIPGSAKDLRAWRSEFTVGNISPGPPMCRSLLTVGPATIAKRVPAIRQSLSSATRTEIPLAQRKSTPLRSRIRPVAPSMKRWV